MKILITGGCGFLGSNLAARAIQYHDHVFIFDNLYRTGSSSNYNWLKSLGDFKLFSGDIRTYSEIDQVIKEVKPELIFHLAGQVAMTTSIANPKLDFEVNVLGTFNLLESIRKHIPQAIVIFSSTNKVYGDLDQFTYHETETRYECIDKPNGFDESTQLNFHSPYGCSKGAADQYILDYSRIFNLKTVVLRHSSIYGRHQHSTYDQGWIGWFCQKAIETKKGICKEPFTISGSGKQVRDVLNSEDIIKLYFSIPEHINEVKGHVFNIGGGISNSLSLLELFVLLEKLLRIHLKFIRVPERISDQKVFIADISKAKKFLNWEPLIDKYSGIADMLSWIENGK